MVAVPVVALVMPPVRGDECRQNLAPPATVAALRRVTGAGSSADAVCAGRHGVAACLTRRMADAWVSQAVQVCLFAVSFKVLVDAVR